MGFGQFSSMGRSGSTVKQTRSFPYDFAFDNPSSETATWWDQYGGAVEFNDNYIVISAGTEDAAGSNSGRVYVYSRSTYQLLWTLNSPNPVGSAFETPNFGCSLALSGNTLAVGAQLDASAVGRVYMFNLATGTLIRTISPTVANSRNFGVSMALDGDNLLIGADVTTISGNLEAGSAEVVSWSTGSLVRAFSNPGDSYDNFGQRVAISGDLALISAPFDDISAVNSGRVYLFRVSTGSLLHTYVDPSPVSQDRWGHNIQMNATYTLIASVSGSRGLVYVYNTSTRALITTLSNPNIETTSTTDGFGSSGMSLQTTGGLCAISAGQERDPGTNTANFGVVYFYDLDISYTHYYRIDNFDGITTSADQFGTPVYYRGNSLLISAVTEDLIHTNSGRVYFIKTVPTTGSGGGGGGTGL